MTEEPPEEVPDEPLNHLPVPSDRAVHILAAVVVLLILTGVALLGARLYVLSENVRDQDRTNAAQDEALKEANRRLEDAGEPTVAVPEPGAPGASGEPGAEGDEGPTGDTGPTGPQGPVGPPGPMGLRGPRGFDGIAGSAGDPGDQGATGPAGQQGQQGPPGPQGESGPKGDKGEPGAQGDTGPAGSATPGTYLCPDGQVLTGFTVAANGDVSLACQQQIIRGGNGGR